MNELVAAADRLARDVDGLSFAPPVTHVYNPLVYAREPHHLYLEKWGVGRKEVVFLGMNPGPWGMAQVGVPFGEISFVRDWIGIEGLVRHPDPEHPKRPVQGFDCPRSEVSGRRLWGYFAERFKTAEAFFSRAFVLNYCPLLFIAEPARNITPDKLPRAEQQALFAACDKHLKAALSALQPQWVVGIGAFAESRARAALGGFGVQIARILHPSPASPAANRGWAEAAGLQLAELGVLD